MATTSRKDFDAELGEYDAKHAETIATVDSMLTLIGNVRGEKARDPLRRLEDVLLEVRLAETELL